MLSSWRSTLHSGLLPVPSNVVSLPLQAAPWVSSSLTIYLSSAVAEAVAGAAPLLAVVAGAVQEFLPELVPLWLSLQTDCLPGVFVPSLTLDHAQQGCGTSSANWARGAPGASGGGSTAPSHPLCQSYEGGCTYCCRL